MRVNLPNQSQPKEGDTAYCFDCNQPIRYTGEYDYWEHTTKKYRHPAIPIKHQRDL